MTTATTSPADDSSHKKTRFLLSQDRQVIEAKILAEFRDRTTDTTYCLPYEQLNAIVRGNVQTDSNLSGKVTKACRSVSDMLKITLGRDPNRGGIVIIPPSQYTGYIDSGLASARRKAKRTAAEASRIIGHAGIPQDVRVQVQARGALCGAIAAFGGKKAVVRLEAEAGTVNGEPLSLNQTIDAFRK